MTTALSNGLAFTTAQKRHEVTVFTIDDDVYHFTPPKSITLILPILDRKEGQDFELDMLRASFDYLGAGLPDDEEARLEGRLRDPDDNLDLEIVVDVVLALLKRVTGVPLAAPGGSSESPEGIG